jgi:hypothetical protein
MLLLLTFCLSLFVCHAQDKKPITNADIVRMSKKGLTENVIIKAIESAESEFDTSVDAIIKLHEDGVSSRVIEAMQEARQKKKQPETTSSSKPITTTSPNIKIIDQPASKPAPVQTQEAGFFTFALDNCSKSGTSIACNFTVANNGQDRQLSIRTGNSNLIDDSNNEAPATYAGIAGKDATNSGIPRLRRDPSPVVLENTSIKLQVTFDGVSANAQRIGRLTIAFYVYGDMSRSEDSKVEFRNVPLAKPAVKETDNKRN